MTAEERALLKLVANLLVKTTDGDTRHRSISVDERAELIDAITAVSDKTTGDE